MPVQILSIEIPEGWLLDSYRPPKDGEFYLSDGQVCKSTYGSCSEYPILLQEIKWREAKPSDLNCGIVPCRYSLAKESIKLFGTLHGVDITVDTGHLFFRVVPEGANRSTWVPYCEVQD